MTLKDIHTQQKSSRYFCYKSVFSSCFYLTTWNKLNKKKCKNFSVPIMFITLFSRRARVIYKALSSTWETFKLAVALKGISVFNKEDCFHETIWNKKLTVWKVFVFGAILVRIFSHWDCIRTRITPNADNFHAVTRFVFSPKTFKFSLKISDFRKAAQRRIQNLVEHLRWRFLWK